jgi:hypothetical protein
MNYKNIGLAGAGIAIIGTFLPFLNITNPVTGVTMASIQLISGDGMFVLLLMAISGVLIFLNKYLFSVIPTILSFAVVLYAWSNVNALGAPAISFGSGFFLSMLGLILAVVSGLHSFIPTKDETE